MLVECGVDHLGFPLRLPVHQEDLSTEEAGRIMRSLPAPARGVLITYLDKAAEIDSLCRQLGASAVQLHGAIAPRELFRLRALAPRIGVIKSLIVRGDNLAALLQEIRDLAPCVDAFITDTFDPETGATGATGKTHDWGISRALVERARRPLILAGGLAPENVRQAILQVRPAGVDVHTGVEGEDGRKSRARVQAFVAAARAGFAALEHKRVV